MANKRKHTKTHSLCEKQNEHKKSSKITQNIIIIWKICCLFK